MALSIYKCPVCDHPHKGIREALFCCLDISEVEDALEEELDEQP